MTTELLDLAKLERDAIEHERKAHALRQIIAGVKALNGDAEAILNPAYFEAHRTIFETRPLDEHGPRGREAVLQIMREHPKRRWKVVQIKREMLRRGWAKTPKAVEATIKRLREDGELRAAGYGHYRLGAPDGSASKTRPAKSGVVAPEADEDPGTGDALGEPPVPAPNNVEGATGVVFRTGL